MIHPLHRENHLIERIGWLRAAVLGANDGIISTSSLVVGVAAASGAGTGSVAALQAEVKQLRAQLAEFKQIALTGGAGGSVSPSATEPR